MHELLSNSTPDPLKKENTQPWEQDGQMILSHEVSNPSLVNAGQVSGLDGQGQVAESRRTETAAVGTAPKEVFSHQQWPSRHTQGNSATSLHESIHPWLQSFWEVVSPLNTRHKSRPREFRWHPCPVRRAMRFALGNPLWSLCIADCCVDWKELQTCSNPLLISGGASRGAAEKGLSR